jgi:peptidoglycan/xylan/chitin deacetylase (PgdA/CDA1 family)
MLLAKEAIMRAYKASLVLRLVVVSLGAMALLSLLVIGDGTISLSFAHRVLLVRPTATPTDTPTPTPTATFTPAPTATPQPPVVYLATHGNFNQPEIALTFDDGPSPGYTSAILDILAHYQVPATFYVLGVWVQRYPDLARAEVAAGHAIGDHSWGHPDLTRLSAGQVTGQLADTRAIIQQVMGVQTSIFRPPYGAYNRQILTIASGLGLSTILWNVDPRDWSRPGTGAIINNILGNTRNGSIILLHDGGGNRSQTVDALSTIIERLRARGFVFVSIPQLLSHLALASGANGSAGAARSGPLRRRPPATDGALARGVGAIGVEAAHLEPAPTPRFVGWATDVLGILGYKARGKMLGRAAAQAPPS